MTGGRHALVVAAQCPDLGTLTELKDAAKSFHAVLTAPDAGACATGHPTQTLLYGEIRQSEIEQAIRAAARAAGQADAVLVLALLGHGIASGGNLYLMASDSRRDELTTTVDVSSLLKQVVETPGLSGIITVVDTCHAAGAVPEVKAIASGIRQGNTRMSLLMGAGVAEEAFNLRFSRTITKIVRQGVERAAECLSPESVLQAVRLDGGAVGQDVHRMDWDGAQFEETGLWLAYNRRHTILRAGRLLGPLALAALARALPARPTVVGGIDGGRPEDVLLMGDIADLEKEAAALGPQEGARARAVIEAVRHCARTRSLLAAWPGSELTSKVLNRSLVTAAPQAQGLPSAAGNDLLRDAVEYLRLRAPLVAQRPVIPLVRFVASLAMTTGVPAEHPVLRQWAADIGADIDLNDAFEKWAEQAREMRLRLVVSLHAAVGDEWPESLTAWLLDGDAHHQHQEFPCRPDRSGVERQIGAALRWASGLADTLGFPLKRVEIAAPAPLLVQWRPEETDYGRRLGDRHDVILRWSDRMQPPEHLWWINDEAREHLRAMEAAACGRRVDWLEENDTRPDGELHSRLSSRPQGRAVALGHRPAKLGDIMATLLAASPIVLWPEGGGRVPEDVRRYVDESWHQLPRKFCTAYRESRRSGPPGHGSGSSDQRDLHRLRAVWDDLDYLEFCRWFQKYTTEGETP
ncbi:caspase family protein [Streptomyces sp. NPDC006372]|uniref:vWA-MoxR associated conflict system protein n=1 Tax=Streptomyces sp. NPDC006372 TaxID=3155599 RepID=UPI0033A5F6AE